MCLLLRCFCGAKPGRWGSGALHEAYARGRLGPKVPRWLFSRSAHSNDVTQLLTSWKSQQRPGFQQREVLVLLWREGATVSEKLFLSNLGNRKSLEEPGQGGRREKESVAWTQRLWNVNFSLGHRWAPLILKSEPRKAKRTIQMSLAIIWKTGLYSIQDSTWEKDLIMLTFWMGAAGGRGGVSEVEWSVHVCVFRVSPKYWAIIMHT